MQRSRPTIWMPVKQGAKRKTKQEVLFSRHLKEKKTKKLQSVFSRSTFAFPPRKGECSNYEPCKGQNLGASRLSSTRKHPHWSCKLPQNKKNISYVLAVSRSRAKSLRQNILQQFQIDLSKLHWIFFSFFPPIATETQQDGTHLSLLFST